MISIVRNYLNHYYKLSRLGLYTGYLLSFFPAIYGLILANFGKLDLKFTILFLFGSIVTRSAGCTINDLLDRNFDKHVSRTKERPLATNAIPVNHAIVFFALLSIISLLILFTLNNTAILIGLFAGLMIVFYPLMKRITYFPQIFLGLVYNLGALIGYSALTGEISLAACLIYLACCFWTIGYDTIYAFMDLIDDKKIGIKSIAIFLENRYYKIWIFLFYNLFIFIFIFACVLSNNHFNPYFVTLAYIILSWQAYSLNINYVENCMVRFKSNNYVGILIALSMILPTTN